jgi:hypothetical protein
MPRKAKPIDPDALLEDSLRLVGKALKRLKQRQGGPDGLSAGDVGQLLRITNALREIERDRQLPWNPRRTKMMTDAELEADIRATLVIPG